MPDYVLKAPEVEKRIRMLHDLAPDSVGDRLGFSLVSSDEQGYLLRCHTEPWMGNAVGTLHGGMIATILDQAMGFAVYALKDGEGAAPSIQITTSYHRPMIPGKEVLIRIRLISTSRTLMTLEGCGYAPEKPDKPCFSGTGTYYLLQG